MATTERQLGLEVDREFLHTWTGAYLWSLAFLTWGVGDTVTTWMGTRHPYAYEAVPINAWALDVAGILGLVAIKILVLASLLVIYRTAPRLVDRYWGVDARPVDHAIPAGVLVSGAQLTLGNLQVLEMVA
ncbi:hypothetical protein [Haloarchaeobius sp. DYHT-AS-18]|uniref:hypothetical protein n=1 Tax=Haloarchaeobius sp. DYHT-AS-18 TaxID=3446117 RepID=UPI003EBA3B51